MKPLVVLRPEPGASMTAERARALGIDVIQCPLFLVEPVAWIAPDPAKYDYLLLTSANAVRHAGPALASLAVLPALAVGEMTAAAARDAGLAVEDVGQSNVQAMLADLPQRRRLLHLAGEHRTEFRSAHPIDSIIVYRAVEIAAPQLPPLAGTVIAVHSARAGARLAVMVDQRSNISLAAISAAAATACGTGWDAVECPSQPTDSALLALAARLCQSRGR